MTEALQKEARIVTIMADRAVEALTDPAVTRAREIAPQLRGIVVTNDKEASRVVDQLALVKDGQKAAKAIMLGMTSVLRRAGDAVRLAFGPACDDMDSAETAGKLALDAWDAEQRRKIREEQERLECQAREAAEAQRANGQPEAPPMEVAPPRYVGPIHGCGATSYATTVVACEVVDIVKVATEHPEWLKLDEVKAKAAFRALDKDRGVHSEGCTLSGVRFWREKSRAIR
jgi:hypothetical protein